MNSLTLAATSLLGGYIFVQNALPFPKFEPNKEVKKLMKERGVRASYFADVDSVFLGKIVEYAGLSYQIYNYIFFRMVVVPLIDGHSLYWIGILGTYYFLKVEKH